MTYLANTTPPTKPGIPGFVGGELLGLAPAGPQAGLQELEATIGYLMNCSLPMSRGLASGLSSG